MHPPQQLSRTPHVCVSWAHRLLTARNVWCRSNASIRGFATTHPIAPSPRRSITPQTGATSRSASNFHNAYSTSTTSRKPLRVAIIGSGPAGFYTAYRLMNKVQDAVIDMYEQLPVPYGLVRFGVAPDHPEVKNCQDTFEQVGLSPRFNYVGNVRVGYDVQLSQLKPHYDAMLFSYGASEDRKLGIPGEDLSGVFSAREFVGWYNGLPQFQGLKPQLQEGDQAVVIGQGNVAMDVARILLTPVDILRSTDITEAALQTLSESKVRSVKVVGRRGPIQVCHNSFKIEIINTKRFPGCIHSQRSPRVNAHTVCRLRVLRHIFIPTRSQEAPPGTEAHRRRASQRNTSHTARRSKIMGPRLPQSTKVHERRVKSHLLHNLHQAAFRTRRRSL
jgi:adrenodoxin-NADP+ reductase